MKDTQTEMSSYLQTIQEQEGWDDTAVRQACGLQSSLEETSFVYLLNFFHDMYKHVDVLYSTFQHRLTTGADAASSVDVFVATIRNLKHNLEDSPTETWRRRNRNSKVSATEVCDILTTNLANRLRDSCFLKAFTVLDPKLFPKHKSTFPEQHLGTIVQTYSFEGVSLRVSSSWYTATRRSPPTTPLQLQNYIN